MDPVTIGMVGVSAATAIAQMYQQEKAAKASAKRLEEIEAMWADVVPPDFDASITDPPELIRSLPPVPSFDMTKLSPEVYKVVAKFEPQAAPLIKEAAPQVVQDMGEGKEGRQAQIDALRKLREISSSGGRDPEMLAALEDAASRAQTESQSRQASILQDAARRGTMGSGVALASQMAGAESAMGGQAAAGRDAALAAYRNRLEALKGSAALGGQVTAADRALSGQNADIINAFNARTSQAAQAQANLASQAANQGQLFNVQTAQDVAGKNTSTANQLMQSERDRADDLAKFGYGAQMGQTQYQNQMAQALADWKDRQKQQSNATKQQQFGNQAAIIGGKSGVQQAGMQNDLAAGQAKSSAIQGMGNAATAGLQYAGNQSAQQEAQDRADRRARYEKTGVWE